MTGLKRTLRQGDTGDDVKLAQMALYIAPDGVFGPITVAAVRDYQTAHGLIVDGIIGEQTWDSLMAPRPRASPELDFISRLVKFAGQGKYVLGAGGTNPGKATPFTWVGAQYGSDCIGFVMWGLGCPRHHPSFPEYEGDINTDSALMDAGLAGLGGAGKRAFFEPLQGAMRPGTLLIYRSVWERDLGDSTGPLGAMKNMGHVGAVVGWRGLKNPEKPDETPWDGRFDSLITIECCAAYPAVRLGPNRNFVHRIVDGINKPEWQPQLVTFKGPVTI